eukprot:3471151-Pyramimonas_sp.AAC.1
MDLAASMEDWKRRVEDAMQRPKDEGPDEEEDEEEDEEDEASGGEDEAARGLPRFCSLPAFPRSSQDIALDVWSSQLSQLQN